MLYLHVYCVPLLSPCPGGFFTSLLSERATLSQRHLTKKKKTARKETGGPVAGEYLKGDLFLKDQRDKAVGAAESFTPACMQGGCFKAFISTGLKKKKHRLDGRVAWPIHTYTPPVLFFSVVCTSWP